MTSTHTTTTDHPVGSSSRLNGVLYDLRGRVHRRAKALERQGHQILRLNIGNPAPFGFEAPESVITALRETLGTAHGYSESQGLPSAREAIAEHYRLRSGFPRLDIDDIFIGNGVSELVGLTLQALIEPGDEVLIPAPDYPLWTASTVLAGGKAVHYHCDEQDGWQPDVEHIASLITGQTRAIVIINPNNPTGAVYSAATITAITMVARQHNLMILSDEIYDRIVYPGFQHISTAGIAPDQPVITFSGLSKTHRLAGYRAGWIIATGFHPGDEYLTGLRLLASMRMCASVPAQHAITAALTQDHTLTQLIEPGGRLHDQRAAAIKALERIPGVTCHHPGGGLYIFPRLDPEIYRITDDEQLILDFLNAEKVLLVHGQAFNLATPDHLRIAFLPPPHTLTNAIEGFGRFLTTYDQQSPLSATAF